MLQFHWHVQITPLKLVKPKNPYFTRRTFHRFFWLVMRLAKWRTISWICNGSPPFARAVATGSDFLLHRDRVDRNNHRYQFLSSLLLLLAVFQQLGARGQSGSINSLKMENDLGMAESIETRYKSEGKYMALHSIWATVSIVWKGRDLYYIAPLLYHPYLASILSGMPSLRLFHLQWVLFMLTIHLLHGKYSLMIIIIVTGHAVSGIYGSRQTELEGIAQEQSLFTNSHKSLATCAVTVIYPIWLVLCR